MSSVTAASHVLQPYSLTDNEKSLNKYNMCPAIKNVNVINEHNFAPKLNFGKNTISRKL